MIVLCPKSKSCADAGDETTCRNGISHPEGIDCESAEDWSCPTCIIHEEFITEDEMSI